MIRAVIKNNVFRQATELVGWQVVMKAINFLTTAWMVRCMGPKNLGVSGLILATSAACSLFVNLGLDIVGTRKIAGAKREGEGNNRSNCRPAVAYRRMHVCLMGIL